MIMLAIGLILFLGVHSVRVWGDGLRTRFVEQRGDGPWKGIYSLVSLLGLVLIVWGYNRTPPTAPLWMTSAGVRHFSSLLVLFAFVLVAAAYVPGNRIKTAVGHPMVLGTGVWAFAHVLSNPRSASLLLFGAFFVWSVPVFISARRRDARAGRSPVPLGISRDIITIVVGVGLWCVFAFYLHLLLFNRYPFS